MCLLFPKSTKDKAHDAKVRSNVRISLKARTQLSTGQSKRSRSGAGREGHQRVENQGREPSDRGDKAEHERRHHYIFRESPMTQRSDLSFGMSTICFGAGRMQRAGRRAGWLAGHFFTFRVIPP